MGGAVLFDKDGTLVRNASGTRDPSQFDLMPGAAEAMARLHHAGYRIAVVSNQPGVALGHFTDGDLRRTEERLRDITGLPVAGLLYCPHTADAGCLCRKPRPELIHRAMRLLDTTPDTTWCVGDILDDIEAGHRAGCRAILYDSDGETEWRLTPLRIPDFVARQFTRVVDFILGV